jgi:hypothetical protein
MDPRGRARLRLDDAGRFVVTRLDGTTLFSELRRQFRERFARELDGAAFSRALARMGRAGLLITQPRALRVLRALREQGVRYRAVERDRRGRLRPGEPDRRRPAAALALSFDQGIYLLNEGRITAALDLFRWLAGRRPADLRLHALVTLLERAAATDAPPGSHPDHDWSLFDRALGEQLSQGRCPTCGAPYLAGDFGACALCGARFSDYVLHR